MKDRLAQLLKRAAGLMPKYKYALIALLAGALLLVIPTGTRQRASEPSGTEKAAFSLADEEARLETILSEIDGAGRVSVMLSVKGGTESVVAVDEERASKDGAAEARRETVIISADGSEKAVVLRYVYPEYIGAVIVAEGAGSSAVRLRLTEAVEAVTGLGSDKITVTKMK